MRINSLLLLLLLFFTTSSFGYKSDREVLYDYKYDCLFIIASDTIPKYEYWIDQNYATKTIVLSDSTSNFILSDTIEYDTLSHGLHTFNIRFKPDGKKWSCVSTNYLYKPIKLLLASPQYEYWLDQNYNHKTKSSIVSSNDLILLDNILYDTLNAGLHTFNIRFKSDGKTWSSVSTSFFYKLKFDETDQPKYQYWFDNNIQDSITIFTTSALNYILLDSISAFPLSEGLHTFNIRFKPDGGQWSLTNTSFFINSKAEIGTEITKYAYWFDDDYNHHHTIQYSGSANIYDIVLASTIGLDQGEHTVSMFFMDNAGYWSSIVKDTFVKDTILPIHCPDNQVFTSGLGYEDNLAYQWQVNDGTGYVNLSNSANYAGVNTDTLNIISPPATWYGNTYRCLVTLPDNSTINGVEYLLKFLYIWTGVMDNNWESPQNWNCNGVPTQNADVIINTGMVNVNSNVDVGSMTTGAGVILNLNEGYNLFIKRY